MYSRGKGGGFYVVLFPCYDDAMTAGKKVLLSGVKPTGRPHIGNYFGAMRQFVDLQDTYRSFIFIADYHALTTVQNREELEQNSIDVTLDYLATGLDPSKVTLYAQSSVGLSTELAWIFDCLTTVAYLKRAHAFKDAEVKDKDINVGIFNYPMLMAADILLFDADVVPVGADQKQHLEITRDTALKFNRIFGEIFSIPEPLILSSVDTVPGTDGRKMSKSYGNTIPLFAEDEEIERLALGITTDSKGVDEPKNPDSCTIFALHRLVSHNELGELERRYREGGIGYKESKELLAENLKKMITPMREYRRELAENRSEVYRILTEGSAQARAVAEEKMKLVRERVGVSYLHA